MVGWMGGFFQEIFPLCGCKLVLARFSATLRIQDGAECGNICGDSGCDSSGDHGCECGGDSSVGSGGDSGGDSSGDNGGDHQLKCTQIN